MRANEIDLENDDLRPVHEIIRARLGRRVAPATLWRWRLKGVNGCRLPMVRIGGIWHSTTEAFAEFVRAQTAALTPNEDAEAEQVRSDSTTRRLRAAGLVQETGR